MCLSPAESIGTGRTARNLRIDLAHKCEEYSIAVENSDKRGLRCYEDSHLSFRFLILSLMCLPSLRLFYRILEPPKSLAVCQYVISSNSIPEHRVRRRTIMTMTAELIEKCKANAARSVVDKNITVSLSHEKHGHIII